MSPRSAGQAAKGGTPRPPYCIHCAGPAYGERDEGGRACSATDGDLCIWSDTRTPYRPSEVLPKEHGHAGRYRESLTPRQERVLRVILRAIRTGGSPPSYREIGAAVGITSTNGVNDFLVVLEKKGFISRPHDRSWRGIRVLRTPEGDDMTTKMRVRPEKIAEVRARLLDARTRVQEVVHVLDAASVLDDDDRLTLEALGKDLDTACVGMEAALSQVQDLCRHIIRDGWSEPHGG